MLKYVIIFLILGGKSDLKNSNPMVSIIIPVYNAQNTIRDCILSCINQNYPNYEVIVVDDGSTDQSRNILKEFSGRITYVYNENKGVSAARNIGINESRGEYIVFCDSDDMVTEKYISNLANARDDNTLIIGGLTKNIDLLGFANSEFTNMDIYFKQNTSKFTCLLEGMLIQGPCCKLFSKKIIQENSLVFDENMCFGEDFKFVLSYLNYVNRLKFINEYIYYYRFNPNSITAKVDEQRVLSFIELSRFFTKFEFDENLQNSDVAKFRIHQIVSDYFNMLLLASNSDMKSLIKYRKMMRNNKVINSAILLRDKSRCSLIINFILMFDSVLIWKIVYLIRKVIRGRCNR